MESSVFPSNLLTAREPDQMFLSRRLFARPNIRAVLEGRRDNNPAVDCREFAIQ